ncbi:MAG: hypothetical protein QXU20_04635, partial [Candidatus Woesearchaeota archaeon]
MSCKQRTNKNKSKKIKNKIKNTLTFIVIQLFFIILLESKIVFGVTVTFSNNQITSLSLAALTRNKFVLVFCDDTNDRIVFRVYDTNGSLVLGDVVVDSSLAVS